METEKRYCETCEKMQEFEKYELCLICTNCGSPIFLEKDKNYTIEESIKKLGPFV